jgi:3-deoxy-D-manno-octulosonic-acid transferase
MPRFIYTVLLYFLIPVYFIRLLIRGASNKDYLFRWNERLGLSNLIPSKNKKIIWIHAVSVGEVNASIPLLRKLMEQLPETEFLVTTTTPTGSDILLNKMGSRVKHQYIPVDLPICVDKFLDKWQPKMLIILETEIWPNLISNCKKRGIYTALVNARLSEKSKIKYARFKSLISPTVFELDLILAQYESDASRFKELADREVALCGNLKFDQDIPDEIESIVDDIRSQWSVNQKQRPVLIAASTHDTEEKIILEAFKCVKSKIDNPLLIIVPRHLERFKEVHDLLLKNKLSVSLRSKKQDVTKDTDVLLGDTMGELNFLYSLSDMAFVGGSLIDHGGQNLLEPASLSLPIISGPSLRNFQEIALELEEAGALKIIKDKEELSSYFLKLIKDDAGRLSAGQSAYEVFINNRGSLDLIIKNLDLKLIELFKHKP